MRDEADARPVGREGEDAAGRELEQCRRRELREDDVRLGRRKAETAGEGSRPAVILGEAVDEVERDEPRRGEDARLVDRAAAEAADVQARGGDRGGVAGEQ